MNSNRHVALWYVATILIVLIGVLLNTRGRSAQTPIPLEDAIAAIEAAENRVETYSWSFHFTRNKLSDPTDPTSIVETGPSYYKGFCLYDVSEGRYLLEFEYVSEWDGPAPFIAGRQGWSFDGQFYRHWERSRHGMELPPRDDLGDTPRDPANGPLIGTISSTPFGNPDQAEMNLRVSGLQHLPPYAYLWSGEGHRTFSRVSERLRQHQNSADENVQVTELPDATWCIELTRNSGRPGSTRIFVDPARGFVLTGAEYHDNEAVYRRVATTVEEVADGVWVPIEVIDYNLISGDADRIVLSDLQVNSELVEDDFRVLFPVGTQVAQP